MPWILMIHQYSPITLDGMQFLIYTVILSSGQFLIGSASHRIPYLLHFQGSSWLTFKANGNWALLRPVLAHGVSLLLPLSHPPLWDRSTAWHAKRLGEQCQQKIKRWREIETHVRSCEVHRPKPRCFCFWSAAEVFQPLLCRGDPIRSCRGNAREGAWMVQIWPLRHWRPFMPTVTTQRYCRSFSKASWCFSRWSSSSFPCKVSSSLWRAAWAGSTSRSDGTIWGHD